MRIWARSWRAMAFILVILVVLPDKHHATIIGIG